MTNMANYEKAERTRQLREKRIATVVKDSGWSYDQALAHMEEAKKKYGILFGTYAVYKLWRFPTEEIPEKLQQFREAEKAKREPYVRRVMEQSGLSYEDAEAHLKKIKKETGCKYKEYVNYNLWNWPEETLSRVANTSYTAKISKKYNKNPIFVAICNNKYWTNYYFHNFIRRAWCVNTKISESKFMELFKDSSRIIYKPIDGIGGADIKTFNLADGDVHAVYEELSKLPDGVVEEFIKQHHKINEFGNSSVNTVRVVTIVTREETPEGVKKNVDIAYVAFRIGQGSSVVDNLHSGGCSVVVDKDTGIVISNGADLIGNYYERHPDSGLKYKGFEIPYFEEIKKFVYEACQLEMVEGNIGWDIAISETGPVLVEVNVGPGVVLIQAPYSEIHFGCKDILDKYL